MKALSIILDKAGRVVIPKPLRKMLNLRPGSRLEIKISGPGFFLEPCENAPVLVKENGLWVHLGHAEGPLADAIQEFREERLDEFSKAGQ